MLVIDWLFSLALGLAGERASERASGDCAGGADDNGRRKGGGRYSDTVERARAVGEQPRTDESIGAGRALSGASFNFHGRLKWRPALVSLADSLADSLPLVSIVAIEGRAEEVIIVIALGVSLAPLS